MRIIFFVSEDKNLGVGYLSSYLKQFGHQVFLLFDPRQFTKSYIQNKKLAQYFSREKYFLQKVGEIRPDLVAFSTVTANYQWAVNLAQRIKEHYSVPIIFGGAHPTLVPEKVIREEAVDMVCVGEAEEALLELADSFGNRTDIKNIHFKVNKEIIINPLRPLEQNLDKHPFPDEQLFYDILPPSYRITSSVITSRGCPFACTYCGNHSMAALYKGQKYVRRRSVNNVILELLDRKLKYKTEHFVFMDDIFASDVAWLRDFISVYKKQVMLPFNCLAHPNLVNEEIINLLKEGGCTTIDFGLQSGSERLRREVLHRFETNSTMARAARACKKHKIHFAVDQILNIPMEKEEDILNSIDFLNEIRPGIINCYSLLYFPKSALLEKLKESGLIDDIMIADVEAGKSNNLYSTLSLNRKKESPLYSYRKYALLMSIIPLLSPGIIKKIAKTKELRSFFSRLPLFLILFVKILVDVKGGLGFIPLSVLKNEFFYIRQYYKLSKN